ncbi:FAD-dependent oxidoreductase [Loktanella sp. S4079]|uniref:FAD-dependent oxidoreductase n=1 Tax=Loktanella sp. S4079 TaxID=579483 RepID=UPI0005FA37D1|nr:FAD-dependent oxidoreductase [Loktanella sp. S4079]KJZ18516.1 FAD-binding dehydrogenase [Loktanella sp. S4079]
MADAIHETCDLLVAGSGAAGMAAAITAAHQGLHVVVVEKDSVIGGTTAWSGGWIWAPCNAIAKANGVTEDVSAPRRYLKSVLGETFNPELVDAFLAAAPEMVAFFDTKTALQFDAGLHIPDTYGHLPGAGMGGRSVIARPYDGRELKGDIDQMRPPLPETTFWGLTIQAGPDLKAFMSVMRSPRSAIYVSQRILRHLWDLAWHGRAMQLRNGQALVGRLLRSALDAGVEIRTRTMITALEQGPQGITGAQLLGPEGRTQIRARYGVVLACGGFPNDKIRRAAQFPHAQTHRSLAVKAATGDGLRLGASAGGQQVSDFPAPGAWCPVSEVNWPDGRRGVFPHIIDRGKPGVIGVLRSGKRFCNEGLGYHDYVTALFDATDPKETPESWLICDHRFLRRYGLGIVRPAPVPVRAWLRSGYLKRGRSIAALAQSCGIDAGALAQTIAEFNRDATRGIDRAFGRGTSAYMRLQGDARARPNPCLAPIVKAPYYAVRVIPGSFGTFAGLKTDGQARVLNEHGAVIPGLYAAGTDMASVMGGHYPAGGINLGPALTFGFVAGRHAAGQKP